MQTNLFRARKYDPDTSKEAARKVSRFENGHYALILDALEIKPMTAKEISNRTLNDEDYLSNVQVSRRIPELREAGLIDAVLDGGGVDSIETSSLFGCVLFYEK